MGVKYEIDGNMLQVFGGNPLKGTEVVATDLRAGAALLIGGLIADGETIIKDAWQIERGYNDIVKKLDSMGVKIQ